MVGAFLTYIYEIYNALIVEDGSNQRLCMYGQCTRLATHSIHQCFLGNILRCPSTQLVLSKTNATTIGWMNG